MLFETCTALNFVSAVEGRLGYKPLMKIVTKLPPDQINVLINVNGGLVSPLLAAVTLLSRCYLPNGKEKEDATPSRVECEDIVCMLLDKGADPDLHGNGYSDYSPLTLAASKSLTKVIEYMLPKVRDIDHVAGCPKCSALYHVALTLRRENLTTIYLLIEHGANPDLKANPMDMSLWELASQYEATNSSYLTKANIAEAVQKYQKSKEGLKDELRIGVTFKGPAQEVVRDLPSSDCSVKPITPRSSTPAAEKASKEKQEQKSLSVNPGLSGLEEDASKLFAEKFGIEVVCNSNNFSVGFRFPLGVSGADFKRCTEEFKKIFGTLPDGIAIQANSFYGKEPSATFASLVIARETGTSASNIESVLRTIIQKLEAVKKPAVVVEQVNFGASETEHHMQQFAVIAGVDTAAIAPKPNTTAAEKASEEKRLLGATLQKPTAVAGKNAEQHASRLVTEMLGVKCEVDSICGIRFMFPFETSDTDLKSYATQLEQKLGVKFTAIKPSRSGFGGLSKYPANLVLEERGVNLTTVIERLKKPDVANYDHHTTSLTAPF